MKKSFTTNQLINLGLLEKGTKLKPHTGHHNDYVSISGENWREKAGHEDNKVGYFYIAIREDDVVFVRRCHKTGELISGEPAPKHKFGISRDLEKRLSMYKEEKKTMKILYSWKIRAYKTLEKYIKQGIIEGSDDRHTFNEFGQFSLHHDGRFHNKSTWGMSEWMSLDQDSLVDFAMAVEERITMTMYYTEYINKHSIKLSHYIPGKTELYFDDSKDRINRLFSTEKEKMHLSIK